LKVFPCGIIISCTLTTKCISNYHYSLYMDMCPVWLLNIFFQTQSRNESCLEWTLYFHKKYSHPSHGVAGQGRCSGFVVSVFESRLSGLVHALARDSVMFLAKILTLVRQCLPLSPPRCTCKCIDEWNARETLQWTSIPSSCRLDWKYS